MAYRTFQIKLSINKLMCNLFIALAVNGVIVLCVAKHAVESSLATPPPTPPQPTTANGVLSPALAMRVLVYCTFQDEGVPFWLI